MQKASYSNTLLFCGLGSLSVFAGGQLSVAAAPVSAPVEVGNSVPEFGHPSLRRLNILATASDGLSNPRDLEFNPKVPGELWVVNRNTEGVVIFHDTGTVSQRAETRKDSFRNHFMAKVSSLAFGINGNFASCQESDNGGNNFMGPTLWDANLAIFANVNQTLVPEAICTYPRVGPLTQLLGSHIDMLHQSPWCMGIAHAVDNAYWTFDGAHKNLVYYDFVQDHGPGYDDHSDGRLRRYTDVVLTRVAGVPSHMVVDTASGNLFIADTGTGRVLKVDPSTATAAGRLTASNEPLAEYLEHTGATVHVFASGLMQPSGLAIHNNRIFVSDHSTGEIIAYSLESGLELDRMGTGARKIMGLTFDTVGQLHYVDGAANTLVRIDAE